MMFVNLNKGGALSKYARFTAGTGVVTRPTVSKIGLELFGEPEVTYLGGEAHGKPVEGAIKANQTVLIRLGDVNPQKFHMMLVTNPDLSRAGTVGAPSLIEPEPTTLSITFRAARQVDLLELSYLARLYLLD